MDQPAEWRLKIEHLMACNCNYGCPCSFNAPPTYGTCEAALAYRIAEGEYGSTSLAGLAWAMAAKWPGPLHELGGRAVVFLDERADHAQRDALEAIATGRAGGPIGIFMSTVTAGIEVRWARIEVEVDGQKSRLKISDSIDVSFAPIRNPVTGTEHRASALLPGGMLTKKEDFFSAERFTVRADGLEFAYPGRNGLTFDTVWQGP